MKLKKLNLAAVRTDGGTQPREEISAEVVADYAEAVKVGIEFPPIVVFDDGTDQWLADGFHRYRAHQQAGKASIVADVRVGTLLEAKLYAVGANATHGLRRTNDDKRRAVQMVLGEPAWADWSDRKIADACGVSHPFVAAMRRPVAVKKADPKAPGVVTVTTPMAGSDLSKVVTVTTLEPEAEPEKVVTVTTADAGGDADVLSALEAAHAEITKLTGEIEAAEANDLKAEALKWKRSCEHAQRQQAEAMDRAKKATEREAWTMRHLRRCGKAVGEDDPKKIAVAVESFVKTHSGVAA